MLPRRLRHILHPLSVLAIALVSGGAPTIDDETNPPAPGFNAAASDKEAIALADATMRAMGGRAAWDRTRTLTWNFFGLRRHVWDKHTGHLRVEYVDRESGAPVPVLMNLNTGEGRVWHDRREITDEKTLAAMLEHARSAWVNDSYWMFMPYKLKDTGVTLKYVGRRTTTEGEEAEVIQLTFEQVGDTPENKYLVYIDPESKLVVQWDFYRRASDDEPAMSTPWTSWRRYGEILLSDSRGGNRVHTDVGVADQLPQRVFKTPDPIDVATLFGMNRN